MIVLKFGGSSLADFEKVKRAARIIRLRLSRKPVVVLSAIGKTTDALMAAGKKAALGGSNIEGIKEKHYGIANELGIETVAIDGLFSELQKSLDDLQGVEELSAEASDKIVSFGERLCVRLFSAYLNKSGIPARHFDGWEAGVITDSEFGNAEFLPETIKNVRKKFSELKRQYNYTPVITGFIAKNGNGRITTLGRGGSDLSATIIGAALKVEEIEVWKDVDGLLTADPRIVKNPKPVKEISFQEASELAYFGAKIFHPRSIIPAMEANVPIRVKNSYRTDSPGTIITNNSANGNELVKAMSFKRNVALIDIVSTRMLGQHGFLSKIFQVFADCKVPVDLVATSEVSVCVTVDGNAELGRLEKALGVIAKVRVNRGNAVVSIVCDQKNSGKVMSAAFNSLASRNIDVHAVSYGASKGNVGLVIEDSRLVEGANGIHNSFFNG